MAKKDNPIEATIKDFEHFSNSADVKKVHDEFVGRLVTIALAAAGLIAALAWDQVFKDLVSVMLPNLDRAWANFVYALLLTFLAALFAVLLPRLQKWYLHRFK